jgi:hypothetical protein
LPLPAVERERRRLLAAPLRQRPDIRRLAALLRGETSSARAVALVEQLLTNGLSPLYGREAEVLREELHRLQYLLSR